MPRPPLNGPHIPPHHCPVSPLWLPAPIQIPPPLLYPLPPTRLMETLFFRLVVAFSRTRRGGEFESADLRTRTETSPIGGICDSACCGNRDRSEKKRERGFQGWLWKKRKKKPAGFSQPAHFQAAQGETRGLFAATAEGKDDRGSVVVVLYYLLFIFAAETSPAGSGSQVGQRDTAAALPDARLPLIPS